MNQVTFSLSDDTLLALRATPETGRRRGSLLASAVKLYELGRLSSGTAAQLAGVPRTLFLTKLADYGVATFRLTEDDLCMDDGRARSNANVNLTKEIGAMRTVRYNRHRNQRRDDHGIIPPDIPPGTHQVVVVIDYFPEPNGVHPRVSLDLTPTRWA